MFGKTVALAVKISSDGKAAGAGIDQVTTKTSKLGKAGALAGKALAAGLGIAVVAGAAAVKAAAEDEQAQVKLANALKTATGARAEDVASVEKWISAQGAALGVADDELRPAMESLVTATKDVGKAQELASIAMDVAARKNLSLESVTKSLAKAQATGNVAALAKYGIATKDAAGKTLSLEQVQKNLADTYKGAAADAADTAAGKQKRLGVAVDELKEKYGAKLIPVLLKASSAGMAVVEWIDQNETAAAAIVITLGSVLAIVKLVSVATTVWSAATKVAAGAQAVFNAVMAANPVVLIVLAVVALAAALVIAYKKSETFRNIVDKAFGAVAATAGAVVGFIKNNWQKLFVILTGPVGLAVVLIVKHWDSIKAGGAATVGWVKDKWSAVKQLISDPVDAAKKLANTAIGGIESKIDTAKNTIDTAGQKISGFLSAAFKPIDTAIGWVESLIDKIRSIPKPDLGLGNRVTGRGGTAGRDAAAGGGQVIHITVNVPGGFVGDERTLALRVKKALADELRRLNIKAA